MTERVLDRTVWHDPASRLPAYRAGTGRLRTVTWTHRGPILDQGNLGGCTGYAIVNALNSGLLRNDLDARGYGVFGAREADGAYAIATTIDPYPGSWPGRDTGSSGLAVCKGLRRAGVLIGYRHAFGADHALGALSGGPVIVGTNWYTSMFEPTDTGRFEISGKVEGGHEYALIGIDAESQEVLAVNSWGEHWGASGYFRLRWDQLERLLSEDGDCTVPIA
jgi:hypothetical protein